MRPTAGWSFILTGAFFFLFLMLCPLLLVLPSFAKEAGNRAGAAGEASPSCQDEQALELCVKTLEAGARASELKPGSFDFETLGKAYFHLNRWDEALEALQKAAELESAFPCYTFLPCLHLFEIEKV